MESSGGWGSPGVNDARMNCDNMGVSGRGGRGGGLLDADWWMERSFMNGTKN